MKEKLKAVSIILLFIAIGGLVEKCAHRISYKCEEIVPEKNKENKEIFKSK